MVCRLKLLGQDFDYQVAIFLLWTALHLAVVGKHDMIRNLRKEKGADSSTERSLNRRNLDMAVQEWARLHLGDTKKSKEVRLHCHSFLIFFWIFEYFFQVTSFIFFTEVNAEKSILDISCLMEEGYFWNSNCLQKKLANELKELIIK